MHFSPIFLAALASFSFASPAPIAEADRDMMDAAQQWTVQKFTRTCNQADTSCAYSFSINPRDAAATACKYTVTASKQASRASSNGVKCGAYTVSSNWSGQFGPTNGFTTLAVVRNKQIIYPAYTDKQLRNGVVVTPDQSYTPQNLP